MIKHKILALISIIASLIILFVLFTYDPREERQATGVNGEIRFHAGQSVAGTSIRLDDGTTYTKCVLKNAASSGYVVNGAVNPWEAEFTDFPSCN